MEIFHDTSAVHAPLFCTTVHVREDDVPREVCQQLVRILVDGVRVTGFDDYDYDYDDDGDSHSLPIGS